MKKQLDKLVTVVVEKMGGPAKILLGWLVSYLKDELLKWIKDKIKKKEDKKKVEEIKKAEEALSEAKTDEEIDRALDDIAKHSRS